MCLLAFARISLVPCPFWLPHGSPMRSACEPPELVERNEYRVITEEPDKGTLEAQAVGGFTLADADCGRLKGIAGKYVAQPDVDHGEHIGAHRAKLLFWIPGISFEPIHGLSVNITAPLSTCSQRVRRSPS